MVTALSKLIGITTKSQTNTLTVKARKTNWLIQIKESSQIIVLISHSKRYWNFKYISYALIQTLPNNTDTAIDVKIFAE